MLQRSLFPKGSSKYVWGGKTSIESIKTVLFVTFLVKIPKSFIYSSALWGIKQQWLYIWTGNWIDSKWRSWRLRWDSVYLVWRRCWKYRTSQFPGKFSSEERVPFRKTEGILTLNHAFQNKCGFVYCQLKGVAFEVTSTAKVVSWTHFWGLSVNQDLGIYSNIDRYFNT